MCIRDSRKAVDIVKSLVETVKRNHPLVPIQVPITKKALVIGCLLYTSCQNSVWTLWRRVYIYGGCAPGSRYSGTASVYAPLGAYG